MNEFINPKSMLTPGAAGAMVMLITNAICLSFGGKPQLIALPMSFILGALVLASPDYKLITRAAFWFINSLIIFSVATGTAKVAAESATATAGTTINQVPTVQGAVTVPKIDGLNPVIDFLIPRAAAQQSSTLRASEDAASQKELMNRLIKENQDLRKSLVQKPVSKQIVIEKLNQLETELEALAAERKRIAAESLKLKSDRAALELANRLEASRQREAEKAADRFFRKW